MGRGAGNLVSRIFYMPLIQKTAAERKEELFKFIMEEGQQALKPCDYCVRNRHVCKMATE